MARSYRWGSARATATVSLVLIWLAPLVELWRDQPNNLRLLWDYFTSTRTTPPLHQTLTAAADAWTIVPFGNHDYVLALHRSPTELGVGVALLLAGLALAVALGHRRRQPLSLALATAGGLGVVVGTISLGVSPAPVYPYYTIWLAYVPVSIMLAIGVALLAPGEPPPSTSYRADKGVGRSLFGRRVVIVCVAAAVIAAALTVQSDLRMGPISATTGSGPWPPGNASTPQGRVRTIEETAALAATAEGVLRPTDRWVNLTIGTPSLWPYVAGIVLQLDRRGVQSTIAPASWALYFGHERAPGHPVTVTFDVYAPNDPTAPKIADDTVVVRLDGAVLAYHRTPGAFTSPTTPRIS
jgi:hypothetical protein